MVNSIMDAQRNNRRSFLQISFRLAQLIHVMEVPEFRRNSMQMLRKLRILIYIIALIVRQPPLPVPRFETVMLDGQPRERILRGRDCWGELASDGPRFFTLIGETPHSLMTIVNELAKKCLLDGGTQDVSGDLN